MAIRLSCASRHACVVLAGKEQGQGVTTRPAPAQEKAQVHGAGKDLLLATKSGLGLTTAGLRLQQKGRGEHALAGHPEQEVQQGDHPGLHRQRWHHTTLPHELLQDARLHPLAMVPGRLFRLRNPSKQDITVVTSCRAIKVSWT
jgi:hypothetical protein